MHRTSYLFLASSLLALLLGNTACQNTSPNLDNVLASHEAILVKNMDNVRVLPPYFRLCNSSFQRHLGITPTRKGLNKLLASGSGQFSRKSLKTLLRSIPAEKIIIVDLRQESHGFLDGTAVSWKGPRNWQNIGKSDLTIAMEENEQLRSIDETHFTQIFEEKNVLISRPLHVQKVLSEEMLVNKYGLGYQRFYVTDHKRPEDKTIDRFIEFIKHLPADTWLHFHCAAGKGRSTTFMSMYDMLINAQDVTLEDILRRQWLLGGADLSNIQNKPEWRVSFSKERYDFLTHFYAYCQDNPHLEQSWSEWLLKKKALNLSSAEKKTFLDL